MKQKNVTPGETFTMSVPGRFARSDQAKITVVTKNSETLDYGSSYVRFQPSYVDFAIPAEALTADNLPVTVKLRVNDNFFAQYRLDAEGSGSGSGGVDTSQLTSQIAMLEFYLGALGDEFIALQGRVETLETNAQA